MFRRSVGLQTISYLGLHSDMDSGKIGKPFTRDNPMTFNNLLKLNIPYQSLILEQASIKNGEVILYFSSEGSFEGKQLKIHFTDYTTATMHNESYFTYSEKDGEFEGHVFKRSDSTSYLDYVRANTTSEAMMNLKLRHYRFYSQNEFFDVLAGEAPLVEYVDF